MHERENLFAKKFNTKYTVILIITKYNGRLPEGVLTPSKLTAYVNLNNHIESNNEKKLESTHIVQTSTNAVRHPKAYHSKTCH